MQGLPTHIVANETQKMGGRENGPQSRRHLANKSQGTLKLLFTSPLRRAIFFPANCDSANPRLGVSQNVHFCPRQQRFVWLPVAAKSVAIRSFRCQGVNRDAARSESIYCESFTSRHCPCLTTRDGRECQVLSGWGKDRFGRTSAGWLEIRFIALHARFLQ